VVCGVEFAGVVVRVWSVVGWGLKMKMMQKKKTVVLSETKQSQLDEQKTNKRKGYGSEKTV